MDFFDTNNYNLQFVNNVVTFIKEYKNVLK